MPLEQKGPIQFSQNGTCLLIRCWGGEGGDVSSGWAAGRGWMGGELVTQLGTACWADQLHPKAQTLPCGPAAPEPGRALVRDGRVLSLTSLMRL